MSTATFNVPDISCSHCAAAITKEVESVAGVTSIDVDVERKTVSVEGEPLDEQAIIDAIDEAGYEVAV